jgi:tetratricopeptide (TPR) repeat protein
MNKKSSNRIFDGNEVRATDLTVAGDESTLVVTFPASGSHISLDDSGFGAHFLQKERISAVVFTASWSHWFQTPEFDAALENARTVAARFRRVVTYGSSMGGYAAAAASKTLGAHAVVSISPQYSVDPAKVPWERRYQNWARKISAGCGFRRDDLTQLLNPTAELHLSYDPMLENDRLHAEALLALSQVPRVLLAPFSGHPTGRMLLGSGVLKPWVLGAFRGEPGGEARSILRTARRGQPLWWAYVARRAYRSRPELALSAARHARALAPDHPEVAAISALPLSACGAVQEALVASEVACAAKPRNPKYRFRYAQLLDAVGRYEEAAAAFGSAAQALNNPARALAGRALALARLGDEAGARTAASAAVDAGARPEFLSRLNLAIRRKAKKRRLGLPG